MKEFVPVQPSPGRGSPRHESLSVAVREGGDQGDHDFESERDIARLILRGNCGTLRHRCRKRAQKRKELIDAGVNKHPSRRIFSLLKSSQIKVLRSLAARYQAEPFVRLSPGGSAFEQFSYAAQSNSGGQFPRLLFEMPRSAEPFGTPFAIHSCGTMNSPNTRIPT